MRRARAAIFGPATLLLALTPVLQATDLPIDLARDPAGTTEAPVTTGSYTVTIRNLAPHFFVGTSDDTYRITIAKEEHALAPLPLPSNTKGDPKLATFAFDGGADPCPGLLKQLVDAPDEGAAIGVRDEHQDLIKGACRNVVGNIVAMMERPEGTYDLRENQSLVITISRGSDKTLRTWKYTYNAPASQGFRISYGFNFIPNADHEYYAKANPPVTSTPSATTYTLTEKNQTKSLDFAPSIFFSFPITRAPWEFAIAAGLGFDFSAPILFLGPSIIMNQNIQLVAGAVMQQQERLRGEYNNGQSLSENLTNDQLTQKTYRPNWFVGLAFRFDTNPFANNSTPAKVAVPTPAPTPKATGDKTPGTDEKADKKDKTPTGPAPAPSPAPAPTPASAPTPAK